MGLPTINATEGLQIEPRWSVVIWMVLAVFLGRLVLNFWWHREQTSSSSSIPLNTPFLQSLQQLLKFIIPIGVLFALVLPAMPFRFSLCDGCGDSGDYLHHVGLGTEHCRGASGFVGPWLRCLLCDCLFLRSLGELL